MSRFGSRGLCPLVELTSPSACLFLYNPHSSSPRLQVLYIVLDEETGLKSMCKVEEVAADLAAFKFT